MRRAPDPPVPPLEAAAQSTSAPSRRRAVTIKHVAAEAGVSLQTVSRVINKGPNVTPRLQERVRAAVAKLGYVPSLAARRLGGSRSYLILAFNDLRPTIEGWQSRRGNDWVDQMLFGGMLKCAELGYRMLFELVDSHSGDIRSQVQAAISAIHPDGVILTPPHSDNSEIIGLLLEDGVPFARVGTKAGGGGHSLYMDDFAAARMATDHLLDLGHRRIALIKGHPEYLASEDRLQGYLGALTARGIAADESLIRPGDFSYDSGTAAAEKLLGNRSAPTAIVASSDEMALAALHVAGRHGVAVPDELSLISFDDTPTIRLAVPPLTAIRQPIAAMTARAVEILIGSLADLEGEREPEKVPFDFIVRESTGPCPRR